MTFECAYDANAKKLVGVRLKPGGSVSRSR